MTGAKQKYSECVLTFDYAFDDGDTQNGVTLTHALHPQVGTTISHADFLPNTNLTPHLLGTNKDGVWTGKGFILMDNSGVEIPEFALTVNFENRRIEGWSMFRDEYRYDGFYLEGTFNTNNNQIINGATCFGSWNGDTLQHLNNTTATLTCSIGEKGAVGYFLSEGNNLPYTGGFVVRPPQKIINH